MAGTMYTVEGIVIGRREVGDSSFFLDILTDELGLIEVSAKGVKKLTSKNASGSALFSYGKFCVHKSKHSYTLNSVEPKYSFHRLSSDLVGLALAVYFADIMKFCTSSEEMQPDLLRLFLISLYRIEKAELSHQQIKAVLELRLISAIGFLPELRVCCACGEILDENMTFYPLLGSVYHNRCCIETQGERQRLTPSVLQAMRHICYSDIEKIFSFSLSEESLDLLSRVTEAYFLNQTGRGYKTLDYYKNMCL